MANANLWLTLSTEKKKKKHNVWVKFYLGQNEDDSLGDSISDSSEKLLQRGKVSIYVILVKGEYMQLSTYFFVRFC